MAGLLIGYIQLPTGAASPSHTYHEWFLTSFVLNALSGYNGTLQANVPIKSLKCIIYTKLYNIMVEHCKNKSNHKSRADIDTPLND